MRKTYSSINSDNISETNITDFKEIIYCKSEGNYTRIYYQDRNILVTKVLKWYQSILPSEIFIRIHKTYIVNMNYILCIRGNTRVVLITDIELPVSRRRRSFIVKELSRTHLVFKLKK